MEIDEIMEEWEKVIRQYVSAENKFNYAVDINIIDATIYEMKSLESKMEVIKNKIRSVRR